MVAAVFLDRDGVINQPVVREDKPFAPRSLDQFVLLEGVGEACKILKSLGYLLIVVTNQPDVGRGTLAQSVVEEIHRHMCGLLPIDHIEVCYDPGGAVPSACRKPSPAMLLNASRLLDVQLAESWMVGDRWVDVDCGTAAGCQTIFLDYGYAETLRQQPKFFAKSLLEAAGIIKERHAERAAH